MFLAHFSPPTNAHKSYDCGQGKAGSGHSSWVAQEPNPSSSHCCLLESALAGSSIWELGLGLEPRHCTMGLDVLTAKLKACPHPGTSELLPGLLILHSRSCLCREAGWSGGVTEELCKAALCPGQKRRHHIPPRQGPALPCSRSHPSTTSPCTWPGCVLASCSL